MQLPKSRRWLPAGVLAVLAAGIASCQDSSGTLTCAIDADCPTGMHCQDRHCVGDEDAGTPDGDGGSPGDIVTNPDHGDLGRPDGGGLASCQGDNDCRPGEVCFNKLCVKVLPDPDCASDDDDTCPNDSYCEPQLDGCVPWPPPPHPPPACEYIPPAGQFTPREEWVWQNPQQAPEWDEVMMTPVVVALDGLPPGDTFAAPAVVFNSFNAEHGYSQDGILRAVKGSDGSPLFSVTDPALYTHPVAGIAAADIDDDGLPEIVTAASGGGDLLCFESDGTLKWRTNGANLNVGWGGPAIANLDGQGAPEIVVGAAVVSADGQVLWSKSGSRGQQPNTGTAAPFSVPADVDGDGDMEIVTGDTLYDHEGSVIWSTGFGDGFVAVANFNRSEQPEIVVVSRGSVRLQSSSSGDILWLAPPERLNQLPECDPNCGLLGPPTVADFDGDGEPEIGVAGSDVYLVLDTSGQVLWSVASRDRSSNITGSAVFDFEGDRRAEVVYADEVELKVLRGADGQVLYSQPHSSLTACEYPVIADVDGDQNAEIVIAQNTLMADAPQKFKGIRVFGDAQDNWVDTRRIWNQHAYHVTNVNEDGSVPAVAERNWLIAGLNNFRQNVQGEGLFQAPDLTARLVEAWTAACQINGLIIWAQVSNRGSRAVAAGVPVSFYRGDPRAGGQLLGTVRTTQPLYPGNSEFVAFVWLNPPMNTPLDIWVVADDDGWDQGAGAPRGENSECREGNNLGYLNDITCLPET